MTVRSGTSNPPPTQVVLLLADGTLPSVWNDLLRRGELPGLERTLLAPAGSPPELPTAVSVFPSTTGPAHLPFLTGRYPGPCNVPGIRWFDPAVYARRPWSPYRFRSYMGLGNYLAARDLSPEVPTLFELLADHASIAGNVRRGVRFSRDLTRWAKLAQNVRSFFVEEWYGMDGVAGRALLRAVERGVRFVFASFYAADSNGHKHGPDHARTLEAYRRIDATVGQLGEALHRSGRAERTLVALVSDHGLSATAQHLDLQALVERTIGCCLAHPTIWHGLLGARAAVMVSGNSMANVYLRGARGWEEPPWLDEPTPELTRLLEALLAEPAVDLVAGRTRAGTVRALSRRGSAEIGSVHPLLASRGGVSNVNNNGRVIYSPASAGDPFGYPATLAGEHEDRALLAATSGSDYPDAPRQLLQLFASPRCGHLVVSATPGYDLRARFEKPAHQGSHGSLHRVHLLTPLLLNRPLPAGPHRTVDLFPTMLDWLGVPPPQSLDGVALLR